MLLQNVPSLNYGDLAALGFSHWTPAGLCQWGMELIQVSTGMPWFWAIVATTLFTRLIILPFNINSLRITARLAPFQPRLTELRAKMSEINNRDPIALQRISLQQKKIYEEAQVSMLQPLLVPALQLPLSLGMFFGVKRLCELPLQQLQVGGLSFLPDLTVADPTYLLPIAMAALINVQLSVSHRTCRLCVSTNNWILGWSQRHDYRWCTNPPSVQLLQSHHIRYCALHGQPPSRKSFPSSLVGNPV